VLNGARRPFAIPVKAGSALAAALALILVAAGPTAAWRHGSIGAGRSAVTTENHNDLKKSMLDLRRELVWERDGIESSIGLQVVSGVSFLVNGKNDGNARFDASTQVTLGLLSAMFHGKAENSFVIGLGTGSSAGWLAAVDTMQEVDVAELEPAILEMARRSTPVNHDVLNDPKVNLIVGDARELLLTASQKYDLIVSEPSNPYRAGIASLYTVEFYEAVKQRLNEGGMLSQWVQAYEISTDTFRTIYATVSSVFEYVETWQTNDLDLVLICSSEPITYDAAVLRERMRQEPYASAMLHTWFVTDLEGLFSRYVANPTLPKQVEAQERGRLNTDDRTLVEFGFARTVGQDLTFSANELRNSAVLLGAVRPLTLQGEIDWTRVEEQRYHMSTLMDHTIPDIEVHPAETQARLRAMTAYIKDDLDAVYASWNRQSREPEYYLELAMVAEAMAEAGDASCVAYIKQLETYAPIEALVIDARFLARKGHVEPAVQRLIAAYEAMRTNPWPLHAVMVRGIKLAQELTTDHPEVAPPLLAAMSAPFAVDMHEEVRKEMAIDLASKISLETVVPYVEAYEPNVLWTEEFLQFRALVYERANHPLTGIAKRQLAEFARHEPQGFKEIMEAKSPPPVYNAQLEPRPPAPGAHADAGDVGQE
jgi:spermidine synthase